MEVCLARKYGHRTSKCHRGLRRSRFGRQYKLRRARPVALAFVATFDSDAQRIWWLEVARIGLTSAQQLYGRGRCSQGEVTVDCLLLRGGVVAVWRWQQSISHTGPHPPDYHGHDGSMFLQEIIMPASIAAMLYYRTVSGLVLPLHTRILYEWNP